MYGVARLSLLCLVLFLFSEPHSVLAAPLLLQSGYAQKVDDPGTPLKTGSALGPYVAQTTGSVGGISFSAGQHPDSLQMLGELHFRLVDTTDGTTVCDTGRKVGFGGTLVTHVMTFYRFTVAECIGVEDTKLITSGHTYEFTVTGFDYSARYGYPPRHAYTSYQSAQGTLASAYLHVDTENIPPFDYTQASFGPYLNTDGQLEFPSAPEIHGFDVRWTTDPGYFPSFSNDNGYGCLPFRSCNNHTQDIFTDPLFNGSFGNFNLGAMFASTTLAGYAEFYFSTTSAMNAGPNNYLYYIRAHISGGVIDEITGNTPRLPATANVLFIPGIKGSVLKLGSDTLWPPTAWSNDLPQLALRQDGSSVNSVVVDGVLETFYGTPIYKEFVTFLDTLAEDETIEAWRALPYDWRYSPHQVVHDEIITTDGIKDAAQEVEELARTARNGKVVIIAHSMGGLVGKALIKKLAEEGKADLIESFIMVGTPQLGTPQATASLLHGDDEGIAGGTIVNWSNARTLAHNLQSAHDLLPSPHYFNDVLDAPITFHINARFTSAWQEFWGFNLNTYQKFGEFLTGEGVPRTPPTSPTRLETPEVLRTDLVENAKNFHETYDNYALPSSIRVVQIAGWGAPTTKAVKYRERHVDPSYETVFTREGDGTVVYPSAVSSDADETYYFNLDLYRDPSNKQSRHKDLLSTHPLQKVVELIVKKSQIESIDFVTKTKPNVVDLNNKLLVSTHSPVILGAYDQNGHFSGISPDQDLNGEVLIATEDIPGSTFIKSGESQYLFLPKIGIYNFSFKGIGSGPTTVEIGDFVGDTSSTLVSYTDIPIATSTSASFVVRSDALQETRIHLDTNNDGVTDIYVAGDGEALTLEELLANLKTAMQGISTTDGIKAKLLKRVASIERKIAKQKDKNATKAIMNLEKDIRKKALKGTLDDTDATNLLKLLEEIENAL